MARVEPVLWQPPSLPYVAAKAVWVADLEDGAPDEVDVRSPRLRQASFDTGVPIDELAMRDLSSFRERGLRPEVVRVRYELYEQRRMEKLMVLVKARQAMVRRDLREAEAEKAAKQGSPQFDVAIEVPKGPSMMERAQQGMEKMLASAAHRAAQADKAQAEAEELVAKRTEASAARAKVAEAREVQRLIEVKKRRKAAAREERKRVRQKQEEAELEAINDQKVMEAFAEREGQLEQAIAQRMQKYEERRAAGIRVQQRAQARVARRQAAVQVAKETAMVQADAKAKAQEEAVRFKNAEAHAAMVAANEKKIAEQAVRLGQKEEQENAEAAAQKVLMEEVAVQAAERLALAKQRQIQRVEESRQRRLDLAARKRDRQRVVAGAVIRLKEESEVRAEEKIYMQEDIQMSIQVRFWSRSPSHPAQLLVPFVLIIGCTWLRQSDRAVKAERNRMRLENKFDEVKRINRQKDYVAACRKRAAMEKDQRIVEQ